MTEHEAKQYGRRTKILARREGITHPAAWWVCVRSYELGIVDAAGVVDVDGPIARAFCLGFGGRP